MVPIRDSLAWSNADEGLLVEALKMPDVNRRRALLHDLAFARQRAEVRRAWLPKERAADARSRAAFKADAGRLDVAAKAFERAAMALEGIDTAFLRGAIDDGLGQNWRREIARWRDWTRLLSGVRSERQRRGAPYTPQRYLAQDVADVLATHGIQPTSTETGCFADVLAVIMGSLNMDEADVHGLVKAVVKSQRTG
jgi:hypothetical protein